MKLSLQTWAFEEKNRLEAFCLMWRAESYQTPKMFPSSMYAKDWDEQYREFMFLNQIGPRGRQ